MIRRPPRSTLFPYTTPLPISIRKQIDVVASACHSRWGYYVRRSENRGRFKNCACRRWNGHECERSEEHTSELQSPDHLVCRLLPEKKNRTPRPNPAPRLLTAS